MTEQTEEITKLLEEISLQGETVRKLKEEKAEKNVVSAAVKKLLELKSKLPEDMQPKKKAKEKKEKKADPRAAKKEARRLARLKAQQDSEKAPIIKLSEALTSSFGDYEVMKSKAEDKLGRKFVSLKDINEFIEESFWIRGYLHTSRVQAKLLFFLIREGLRTIQVVVSGKDLVKFGKKIPNESVIDIFGKLVKVDVQTKATESQVEIQVEKVFVVGRAERTLPFQVIDAARSEEEIKLLNEQAKEESKFVSVGLDTRLDTRNLDLRTPLSQSIVRINTTICSAFRNFLVDNDFLEIQTPKLLYGASEGGAEVFKTSYFGNEAFLAQSPQLHKQISAACSGLERVFELAPVFRAENSNTNRHLCEFQGLDLEMCFKEHYHEVLDMFSDLFNHIFTELNAKRKDEINTVRKYFLFEDLVFRAPASIPDEKVSGTTGRTLRIEFKEAIELLREAGFSEEEQGEYDDLSTPSEKKLGELVKQKYGVDFYFLDKFPLTPRPFYTMPCPENPNLSNSYDFFIRGQEIMSGAQRVHIPELLEERIKAKDIDPESLRFYIDAFKAGARPHGGGGVGLERVCMLFLGLPNIRLVRMFPRDPTRLIP
eukprot:snap_masked-scaffold_25-processed-gene-5.33-mRNA-1 protein AED:0.10 eAED:0.10 QI:0/-1/0/1/-1/1/1/0/597